ncbi:MAG TPA: sugar transferase [Candidatus Omnitrophota bacterium]|nr:sugar transferase [Candidatus Omnitrophota bacterium]HPD84071.1 sugar transferase [Candidatus Omnitrophota bacterium]HRZ02928.1 sugar transferase [Candidatus Omnitrophota bacterium]
MRPKNKNSIIRFLYIVLDIYITYVAIFIACLFRQEILTFPVSFHYLLVDQDNPFRILFLSWIFLTVFFNNLHGLYQTRRELFEGVEIWLIIKSICLSSLGMITLQYILKIPGFPRSIFIISIILMILSLSLWRAIKRVFVEYLVSHGYNNFNALIIGAGRIGTALFKEIEKRPGLGIRVVGFLDDLKVEAGDSKHAKVLGKISDFAEIARKEFVNKIFITVHHDSNAFLNLLEQAREMNIAVRVVPQGFDLTSGEFFKYNIGLIPILEYADVQNLRKQAGKRIFDLIISLAAFIVLLPVFFVIGVIIKFDSAGPVFYMSKRYGKGGKIFNMYKFRSMTRNADKSLDQIRHQNEVDGPIFKIKKDPRVTKFGAILRKYSLDELPQIINVLQGEMSLVGPRPLPIDQIEKEDLKQLKRLEVRPGMTGLWQIRGRSDVAFSRLVKWDIWYINNWSFWLDLNILFQTIPVVLKGKGAY